MMRRRIDCCDVPILPISCVPPPSPPPSPHSAPSGSAVVEAGEIRRKGKGSGRQRGRQGLLE